MWLFGMYIYNPFACGLSIHCPYTMLMCTVYRMTGSEWAWTSITGLLSSFSTGKRWKMEAKWAWNRISAITPWFALEEAAVICCIIPLAISRRVSNEWFITDSISMTVSCMFCHCVCCDVWFHPIPRSLNPSPPVIIDRYLPKGVLATADNHCHRPMWKPICFLCFTVRALLFSAYFVFNESNSCNYVCCGAVSPFFLCIDLTLYWLYICWWCFCALGPFVPFSKRRCRIHSVYSPLYLLLSTECVSFGFNFKNFNSHRHLRRSRLEKVRICARFALFILVGCSAEPRWFRVHIIFNYHRQWMY